ncbi:helix-turn-helix domain protein [Desulfurispirillum indicum S5]|uniref:Helix-turn-helix domain protein n=1 Tax=Desulfurispirillum indicum (strain ATCC BAA-1389 / DSM 22839 / S5) TaxID=653733 RepID=E6W1H8_DESIS|nr:helix-turn-helix transcriptional regulator [Desulfurispirillum indicum]ADU65434.1 helix-turn-helix domain protein [Desulfurispirillum indicum S5]
MTQFFAPTPEYLGKTLQALRKAKGLTQEELAKLAGVKQSTVSHAENNTRGMRIETLYSLLAALDLYLNLRPRQDQARAKEEWQGNSAETFSPQIFADGRRF